MPDPATIVETPRLIMRPHRVEDFASSKTLWTDPVFLRYFGGKPMSHEEVWVRVLRYAGSWALLGYGFWAVIERETGDFVGEVGFHELQRATEPSFIGVPEIGWGFAPAAQGRGFAREAVAAALAWGDANITADRFVCMINPENEPSLRVALGAGFSEWAKGTYKDNPIVLFSRPVPAR